MTEPTPQGFSRVSSGCGVTGCLYGAVGLFFILLVGMLIVAVIRFSSPPEPRLGPQPETPVGTTTPASQQSGPPAPRDDG